MGMIWVDEIIDSSLWFKCTEAVVESRRRRVGLFLEDQ
jgi:hypothetical protein